MKCIECGGYVDLEVVYRENSKLFDDFADNVRISYLEEQVCTGAFCAECIPKILPYMC